MSDSIMDRCEAIALRMTGQRRIIAGVLEESDDHPDVEELYARASALDAGISIATVYRTVKLFEEAGILERVEGAGGREKAAFLDIGADPSQEFFKRGENLHGPFFDQTFHGVLA